MAKEKIVTNLPWILSQWHAISGSSAPIKMDGVLFQDIYSIIKTMLDKPVVKDWMVQLKAMYDHLSNYENPHKLTVDMFKTRVIDVIYRAWRTEGYMGSMEFFIKLLFTYLEIIQFAELMKDDNLAREDLIPSVLAVAEYIKAHNEAELAHEPILEKLFAGNLPLATPTTAFYQFVGVPPGMDHLWHDKSKSYRDIWAFDHAAWAPQEYTIVGAGRFRNVNQFMFGIHGLHTGAFYFVEYSWDNKEVYLKWRRLPDNEFFGFDKDTGMTPYEVQPFINDEKYWRGDYDTILARINVAEYYKTLDEPDFHLGAALIVKRHVMQLATYKQSDSYKLSKLVKVVADYEYPYKAKGPINPRLTFARMDRDDPLYSVSVYRKAMDDDQIVFLMENHQFPLIQTV